MRTAPTMNIQSVKYKPNHPITDEPSKGVVAIIRNPVTDEDEEFSILPIREIYIIDGITMSVPMEWVMTKGNKIADAD